MPPSVLSSLGITVPLIGSRRVLAIGAGQLFDRGHRHRASRAIVRIVVAVAPYAEACTAVITALRELDAAATQTASVMIEAGAEPGTAE